MHLIVLEGRIIAVNTGKLPSKVEDNASMIYDSLYQYSNPVLRICRVGGNDSSVTPGIRMKMLADSTRWVPFESITLTTRMHEHEPTVSGEMAISNVHSVTGPEVTPC